MDFAEIGGDYDGMRRTMEDVRRITGGLENRLEIVLENRGARCPLESNDIIKNRGGCREYVIV